MAEPQTYEVKSPDGRSLEITGDRMPTESELKDIFKALPSGEKKPTPTKSSLYGRAALGHQQGEALVGFGKKVVSRLQEGGDVLRKRYPILQKLEDRGITPKPQRPTLNTPAEKFGAKVEPFAEFVAGGSVGGATKLTGAAKLGAEAATTYGIAKSQGDPHAAATTLISMVPGFASISTPAAWYASAEKTMTRILESAASARNQEQVMKSAAKVLPLALDRTMLRLTKGGWAKAVDAVRQTHGQAVKDVIKSAVGNEPLPVEPVIQDLEQLKNTAQAIVPVGARKASQVRAGITGVGGKKVTIEPTMVNIIDKMQQRLTAAGGETGLIQARELVKFKRIWDKVVYKSKPFLDPTARTEFKKEAYLAGADAIRRVIATEPAVSLLNKVDQAFHTHNQLYSLISEVSFKEPFLPIAFGWKNIVMKQLMKAAVKSPSWRLASTKMKLAIGDAIASGSMDRAKSLLAPIIAGEAAGSPGSKSPEKPPMSKEDLLSALSNPDNWKRGEVTAGVPSKTLAMIPKSPEALNAVANTLLRKLDYLGFDTLAQARGAIRSHPDWAERWAVDAPHEKAILDFWKRQQGPMPPSMWESMKQYIYEATRAGVASKKEATDVAAKTARAGFEVVKP